MSALGFDVWATLPLVVALAVATRGLPAWWRALAAALVIVLRTRAIVVELAPYGHGTGLLEWLLGTVVVPVVGAFLVVHRTKGATERGLAVAVSVASFLVLVMAGAPLATELQTLRLL